MISIWRFSPQSSLKNQHHREGAVGLFTVYASESVSETFLRRRGRGGGVGLILRMEGWVLNQLHFSMGMQNYSIYWTHKWCTSMLTHGCSAREIYPPSFLGTSSSKPLGFSSFALEIVILWPSPQSLGLNFPHWVERRHQDAPNRWYVLAQVTTAGLLYL